MIDFCMPLVGGYIARKHTIALRVSVMLGRIGAHMHLVLAIKFACLKYFSPTTSSLLQEKK